MALQNGKGTKGEVEYDIQKPLKEVVTAYQRIGQDFTQQSFRPHTTPCDQRDTK